MHYDLVTNIGIWRIEPDEPRSRWLLKLKRKDNSTTPIDFYEIPEKAADAVCSFTGIKEWDSHNHVKSSFALENWTKKHSL